MTKLDMSLRRRVADVTEKRVAVYGMGFVGLTLAATFANCGLKVIGVDSNPDIVSKLKRNQATFFEKGLDSLLSSVAASNPIGLAGKVGELETDVHIISVGTPVGKDKKPDLNALQGIVSAIAKVLKVGDLVILRSTVPVGTTRNIVLPILEQSGLTAGKEFYLAFAPERTAEGKALEELRILPQIVGGIDPISVELTRRLFAQITNSIIEVDSIEAAELVKLLNNTFRDLVFSFANEAAMLCDAFNLDAFKLIHAATEGYPRNPIPLPSPGVAGVCLSKDPYLYSSPFAEINYTPILGLASRKINERGAEYVIGKLNKFCAMTGRNLSDLRIFVVGLAFKGMPETSDHRGSVALELLQALPDRSKILVKDFVVESDEIRKLGFTPVEDLVDGVNSADAIIVMNNHYSNNRFNVVQALQDGGRPRLFFDGWHMFDRRELESIPGVCYATMGYMTQPA